MLYNLLPQFIVIWIGQHSVIILIYDILVFTPFYNPADFVLGAFLTERTVRARLRFIHPGAIVCSMRPASMRCHSLSGQTGVIWVRFGFKKQISRR